MPPDEIERGLSLGWPRDTPKTVIDMEAYQTAQRIMSSWGLRPDKRGFDWYTMPDGSNGITYCPNEFLGNNIVVGVNWLNCIKPGSHDWPSEIRLRLVGAAVPITDEECVPCDVEIECG